MRAKSHPPLREIYRKNLGNDKDKWFTIRNIVHPLVRPVILIVTIAPLNEGHNAPLERVDETTFSIGPWL